MENKKGDNAWEIAMGCHLLEDGQEVVPVRDSKKTGLHPLSGGPHSQGLTIAESPKAGLLADKHRSYML